MPQKLSPNWIMVRSLFAALQPPAIMFGFSAVMMGILEFANSSHIVGHTIGALAGMGGIGALGVLIGAAALTHFALASPPANAVELYLHLHKKRDSRLIVDRFKEALRSNNVYHLMAYGQFLLELGRKNEWAEEASVAEERKKQADKALQFAQSGSTNGNAQGGNNVLLTERRRLEERLTVSKSETEDGISKAEAQKRLQVKSELRTQISLIDQELESQAEDTGIKLEEIKVKLAKHEKDCESKYRREIEDSGLQISENMDPWIYMSQGDREIRTSLLADLAMTQRMSRAQILADDRMRNCASFVLLNLSTRLDNPFYGVSGEVFSGTWFASNDSDDHMGYLYTRLNRALLLMEMAVANANRWMDPKTISAQFDEAAGQLKKAIEDVGGMHDRFHILKHQTAQRWDWFFDKTPWLLKTVGS